MKQVNELEKKVKEIQRKCLERTLSPLDAVEEIDQVIGGITRVDYKTGLKLKFSNHDGIYALDVRGVPKKVYEIIEALAVLGYKRAQTNGSINPGEVHIDRTASTKHHKGGIEALARRYAA